MAIGTAAGVVGTVLARNGAAWVFEAIDGAYLGPWDDDDDSDGD
jgi:hypothetical protein